MSKWCDVCHREPYRGCDSSCPIFGLSLEELAKKYFQDIEYFKKTLDKLKIM